MVEKKGEIPKVTWTMKGFSIQTRNTVNEIDIFPHRTCEMLSKYYWKDLASTQKKKAKKILRKTHFNNKKISFSILNES